MKIVKVHRIYADKDCTLGTLIVMDGDKAIFSCATLELPWRNNAKGVSRVPAGVYPLVREYSPKFKSMLYELKNVPGRSEAKIHAANFATQLNGCIALGRSHVDINGDGIKDVDQSKKTLAAFHKAMGGDSDSQIIITDWAVHL